MTKTYRPTAAGEQLAEQIARMLWEDYCRSSKKPTDIPDRPDLVYASEWKGWVDWLGGSR
jgi:hypothetical protein